MYGVGFQYKKVSQLVPFLFYLFGSSLFLQFLQFLVCVTACKDKQKHYDFQNHSGMSVGHSF